MAADGRTNPNLLVLPFPAQGHISPVLAFSKFLASKGLNITILTTTYLTKSAKVSLSSSSINTQAISDGSEDDQDRKETTEEFFARFKRCVSQNLANFLDEQIESGSVARAIMYDSCLPWVLDIARGRGLLAASFFTQSCSVCAVYYHLKNELLMFPDADRVVSMPALPRFKTGELPVFPKVMDPNNTIMNFIIAQFSNLEEVDWIFFNTFDKLEYEVSFTFLGMQKSFICSSLLLLILDFFYVHLVMLHKCIKLVHQFRKHPTIFEFRYTCT